MKGALEFQASHPSSLRSLKIGRKALLVDRMSRTLANTGPTKAKRPSPTVLLQPRAIAIVCIVAVVLVALGFACAQYYRTKAAEAHQAAAVDRQKKLIEKSAAADACRRKIAEQKADLIGKVTYDELYNHGECDK